MTARCTPVSTRSWRTSFTMVAGQESAWTMSISSSPVIGSARSHPKRKGTWGASRRATSAPSGLETPVIRTRESLVGVPPGFWVNASHCRRVGHALRRERIGRQAHVDALVDRCMEDLVEGPRDDVVQLRVDLLLLPEESLEVLHPLEIRHDHAARVRDDVRDQEDVPVVQDRVVLRRDGRVSSLCDEPGTYPSGILLIDLILHGCRHQNRHRQLEELRAGDAVRLLEAAHPAADLTVLVQCGKVKAA